MSTPEGRLCKETHSFISMSLSFAAASHKKARSNIGSLSHCRCHMFAAPIIDPAFDTHRLTDNTIQSDRASLSTPAIQSMPV